METRENQSDLGADNHSISSPAEMIECEAPPSLPMYMNDAPPLPINMYEAPLHLAETNYDAPFPLPINMYEAPPHLAQANYDAPPPLYVDEYCAPPPLYMNEYDAPPPLPMNADAPIGQTVNEIDSPPPYTAEDEASRPHLNGSTSEQLNYIHPYPGQQQLPQSAGYNNGYPPRSSPMSAGYDHGYPPRSRPIVVVARSQILIYQQAERSFMGHMVLACLVLWLCNYIFGAIAFRLARRASVEEKLGNRESATSYGRGSIGVSIAGIFLTIIIVIILVVYLSSSPSPKQPDDTGFNYVYKPVTVHYHIYG